MQFTKFYYGNDSENTKLTLLNMSRSLFILMYKWSLTRPTVWNIKANFKVVRLAAVTSEIGERTLLTG